MTVNLSDADVTAPWNISSYTPSDEQGWDELSSHLFLRLLPTIFFVALQIAVGLPGNLLVFLVYFRQFRPSSTRVFILAMAVCDLLTNAVVLPLHIVSLRFQHNSLSPEFCRFVNMTVTFPIIMSAWILVCVSLDRRRRICQPHKKQMSAKQATWLLFLPFGLACLVTLPFTVFYGDKYFDIKSGLAGRTCGFKGDIRRIYGVIIIVSLAVGLALMAFAYVSIAVCIYQQQKRRESNFSRLAVRFHEDSQLPSTMLDDERPSEFGVKVEVDNKTKDNGSNVKACVKEVERLPIFIIDAAPKEVSTDLLQTNLLSPSPDHGIFSDASNSAADPKDISQAKPITKPSSTLSLDGSALDKHEKVFKASIILNSTSLSAIPQVSDDALQGPCDNKHYLSPRGSIANGSDVSSKRSSAPAGGSGDTQSRHLRNLRRRCSRTTVMMFVLTLTIIVCFCPFAIAT